MGDGTPVPSARSRNAAAQMSLKAQITEDMKAAMRAKDTARLAAIRLLLAAMKQREVDERIEILGCGHARHHRKDAQATARLGHPV